MNLNCISLSEKNTHLKGYIYMTFLFPTEKYKQKTNKWLPGVGVRGRVDYKGATRGNFGRQGTISYLDCGGYYMIVFHLSKLIELYMLPKISEFY